ncbi:hypothetical protein KL86APRO_12540 [uncultured Alphaproteobacteria bacterium]|uniref:DUF2730 family protein n=1 Tax=uncultured Alphaproteobacteria bacterium TaxID=91750 RepID=A0A212KC01_9PROT|nr:hypothetical protein KL86APRO_12540 [uncultured Alphaproteobacteria bacterium]
MIEALLKWWPVLVVIAQAGLGWMMWSLGKRFVPREEFETYKTAHADKHEAIGEQLQEGQQQFTRISTELQHLPNRNDIDELKAQLHQVDKGVVRLNGAINVVAAKLGAVEKPVDLMMRIGMEEN